MRFVVFVFILVVWFMLFLIKHSKTRLHLTLGFNEKNFQSQKNIYYTNKPGYNKTWLYVINKLGLSRAIRYNWVLIKPVEFYI